MIRNFVTVVSLLGSLLNINAQSIGPQIDGYDQKFLSCYGPDISELVGYSSASECALKCNSTANCQGFVWEQWRKCIPVTSICDNGVAGSDPNYIQYVKRVGSTADSNNPLRNGLIPVFLPGTSLTYQQAPQIMLSYSWAQKSQVKQIREVLKAQGFNVWIDDEKMTGSILDSMADAVEKSQLILVGMSEAYRNSQSCKTEAEYAYRLKKDLIPLMMQSKFTPDGWLGAMIGNRLYFDMSSDENIRKNINSLIKEINNKLTPSNLPRLIRTSTEVSIKSATLWTQQDVTNWLYQNNLPHLQSQMSGFNGSTLAGLQTMLLSVPQIYYESVRRDMGVGGLVDLLTFTNALRAINFS